MLRISATSDYALRAAAELASRSADGSPVTAQAISAAQAIPMRYVSEILGDLRRHGVVASRRGVNGGWWLAKPATKITVADIIDAVQGPFAQVGGNAPEELCHQESARAIQQLWINLHHDIRQILDSVSLADLVGKGMPIQQAESKARAG
jgi:Rrf2 family protein